MKYVSTRGQAPAITFEDVLLSGPAPDGGLYMPDTWPQLDFRRIQRKPNLSYADLAATVLAVFATPDWYGAINNSAQKAYAGFDDPRIAPLRELGPHRWLLELFHGPTLAFKDFALQLLAPLMNEALARRGKRALVIAATSGDTGAAAVAALENQPNLDLLVLHPRGRISDVQRRQMTTTRALNISNVAIEGTFDDAQALVKQLFADRAFATTHNLAAINSINWVRIAAQAAYYISTCLALQMRHVNFSVPTGNFGDAFAGYVARKLGAPVGTIVIATNSNDILARTLETGTYARSAVKATLSPAMDIQVASNFERLLFECAGHDSLRVRALMESFEQGGSMTMNEQESAFLRSSFSANTVFEPETVATMKIVHARTGLQVDPHTAVGLTATRVMREADDVVTLATAHPGKFPDAVALSTGKVPELPQRLQWIMSAHERYETLPNSLDALRDHVALLQRRH